MPPRDSLIANLWRNLVDFWPFRERDVNELMYDCVEYGRPTDKQKLVALLMNAELFSPVFSGPPDLPNGTRDTVSPGGSIRLTSVRVGEWVCVPFYTDRSKAPQHLRLISMTGEEAMRMVLKMEAGGISIQNNKKSPSCYTLSAQGIREVLASISTDIGSSHRA